MAKNRIQYGLYYGIDEYTKEEELYAAIPNTANGNCLFESLAYFRDDQYRFRGLCGDFKV